MNCPKCSTENIPSSIFCKQCGGKIKDEPEPILWTGIRKNICTNCFYPSFLSQLYCIRCGHKLPQKEERRQRYLSQEKIFISLLVSSGIISEENRIEIENINKGKSGYTFLDSLITYQFVKEAEVLTFLSEQLAIPFVPISHFQKPDKSLLQVIPEGVARRQNVCVVGMENGLPLIAMSDPISITALTELRSIIHDEAQTIICPSNDIKKTLDLFYPRRTLTPHKIKAASQIDAYDVESDNVRPIKNLAPSSDRSATASEAVIKSTRKKGKKLIVFSIVFVVLAAGGIVFLKNQDRIFLPKYLKSGDAHFASGNYQQAIKDYRFYLKHQPKNISIHLKLGKALNKTGAYLKAIDHFEEVISADPKNAEAHYLAGMSNFDYRAYGEAIDKLTKALSLDPTLLDGHKYIGIANIRLGDSKSAITHLEKTIRKDPKDIELTEWLVKAYLNTKQYKKTISLAKSILAQKRDLPEVWYHRGYAEAALGNFKQAITHYKESGLFYGNSPESDLKKAFSLMDENNLDESISEYVKVITLRENDPEAYNNLGIIYKKKGNPKASREAFKKAKRFLRIY